MPTIQFTHVYILNFFIFFHLILRTVHLFLFSEYFFCSIWSVFPSYLPYSSSCVTGLKLGDPFTTTSHSLSLALYPVSVLSIHNKLVFIPYVLMNM